MLEVRDKEYYSRKIKGMLEAEYGIKFHGSEVRGVVCASMGIIRDGIRKGRITLIYGKLGIYPRWDCMRYLSRLWYTGCGQYLGVMKAEEHRIVERKKLTEKWMKIQRYILSKTYEKEVSKIPGVRQNLNVS